MRTGIHLQHPVASGGTATITPREPRTFRVTLSRHF